MYDFVRGAKVAGSKSYFNVGDTALLELELVNRMMRFHAHRGYTPIIPPYFINKQVGEWAGILPRFDGDYYEAGDGKILIPTAETPLVGMHAGEILDVKSLPLKYVAFSPCFRKEAGAGGQRDAGLRRVHQFHKVELFVICDPMFSQHEHESMVQDVHDVLMMISMDYSHKNSLEWRTVELTEEDRSPVSNKTIDFELKHGDDWLEVSSVSNMGNNQSIPADIRYKADGLTKVTPSGRTKPVATNYAHMLNGSGVALPRLMLALGHGG